MPLQIRRGTQAERDDLVSSYVALPAGEPLWCTDTGNLYVGDGATSGGVHVNPAPTIDLETYSGSIGQFEKNPMTNPGVKSPFITVDGVTATIDLDGQISGHISPKQNESYDLGSENYRYRRIYVGGNGIAIGEALISATNGTWVDLPAGSTVGGFPIEGVVPGNTYQINIGASDSTIILDYNSASLRGSVVAVDDTILVNGTDKTISNGVITLSGDTVFTMGSLNFGTAANPTTISAYSSGKLATFTGVTTSSSIEIKNSRGSLDAPLASNPGDPIAPIKGFAYDGAVWDQIGSYGLAVDPDVPVSAGSVAGSFFVSTEDEVGASKVLSFNSKGILTAPVFKAASYPTISLPSTPEEGWMVFDSTTKEFKGWNGTSWVVLG